MDITSRELDFLNFYRASELHGGLILGQVVRRARDPELVLDLTRHSAEEVMHAQLWTETIIAVGGRIRPVRETYQARYARSSARRWRSSRCWRSRRCSSAECTGTSPSTCIVPRRIRACVPRSSACSRRRGGISRG